MLAVERAVPIYYAREGGWHSASGFLIDGEHILTADHCAEGTDYRVLIDDRNVSARVYLRTHRTDIDLAVLRLEEKQDIERVRCARIRTSYAERLDNCCVLAFPVWKRNGRAQLDGYVPTGEVSVLAGLSDGGPARASLLAFKCVTPPPASSTGDGHWSQWKGASGAAIVHDGHVIGVLSNHVLSEGDSSLAFTPITAIDRLDPDERAGFASVFGITNTDTLPTFPKDPVERSANRVDGGQGSRTTPVAEPVSHPDSDTETLFAGGQLFADQGECAQAESLWRRAASQGHTGAMNNLANALYGQRKVLEAHEWYLQAAERGNLDAMVNLAALLFEARKVRDADRWWRQAAEAGDTDAIYGRAVMLDKTRRFEEALAWYRQAAEAGHSDAMHNLAVRLRCRGEPVEAAVWWQRAGHDRAQRSSEKPRGPLPRRQSR